VNGGWIDNPCGNPHRGGPGRSVSLPEKTKYPDRLVFQGGRVRRATCLLLAASLLLVPSTPAQSATVVFAGEVEVEYNPDSITLGPGEMGVVYVMVRNRGDRTLHFQVEAVRVDAPGASSPEVMNRMFILPPGGVDQVVVTIESRARILQDPDISDVKITFRWGPNVTSLDGGAFRLNDPVYQHSIEYDVEDDMSEEWTVVLGTVMALAGLVTVAALLRVHLRRRRGARVEAPAAEPYGEGAPDRKDVLMVRHVPSSTISLADEEAPFEPLRGARKREVGRRARPPQR
jgi:hypothetical protein